MHISYIDTLLISRLISRLILFFFLPLLNVAQIRIAEVCALFIYLFAILGFLFFFFSNDRGF